MKTLRLFALLLLVCSGLWAQATAQIQGTIQDASGSAVPSADVKAIQTDTGATRNVSSAADGTYVLANLPIGPYRIEVSKQGFSTFVQTGVVLQVATNPTIDVAMKVGNVSEQVQVEANAALVETQTTTVGAVIENQRILELPLNGRQATDLIQLAGAAIPTGVAGAGGFPGTGQIVIAGGQSFGVGFYLDGGLFNNPWDNANLPFPFPDALQEFKVESSSQLAGTGMHSGGTINAVTKAGTNQLHGAAFEFLRNGAANGHNFFQTIPDNLKRNQYGGTIGGPVIKDRFFLFGGFQGTNTSQFTPAAQPANVPTAQMLGGDFTGCSTTAAVGKVDPALFNKASVDLASKLPKSADPCGRIDFGFVNKVFEYQVVGRADYQISSKQSIFGRYVANSFNRLPANEYNKANILTTAQNGLDDAAQSYSLGHTYLISPTTVNQFRAGYNRVSVGRYNSDFFSLCDLKGVSPTLYCGYVPHQSAFTIGPANGFTLSGGTLSKASSHSNTYQLGDDISLVRGSHTYAFGVMLSKYDVTLYANVYSQGIYAFGAGGSIPAGVPIPTSGVTSPIPNFLFGNANSPNSITISSPNNLEQKKYYVGAYAQDTWKINPRLTMNYGVRYEPFLPPSMTNGAVYNFSYADFLAGKKTAQFVNAPAGLSFPGDTGFAGKSGVNSRLGLFAPRVGFAFDPTGKGRTSIRASIGLGYDFMNGQLFVNTANAPPYGNQQIFSAYPWSDPWASNPGGNIYPYAVNRNVPFAPFGTYVALQPNAKTTTAYLWNLTVQRQFGNDWLLSASYLGSQTAHLWVSYQLNPGLILTTCPAGSGVTTCNTSLNLNQRRLFSQQNLPGANLISYMDQYDDGGTASYHGLMVTAQKRFSKGISLNSNYTWSHCIGDLAVGNSTGNFGTGLINPNNRAQDRGNCTSVQIGGTFSSDRRHIFNMTVVGEVPKFAGHSNLTKVASGWKLAGIYRATSGPWLTMSLSADRALNGANNNAQRPVQIRENVLCANPNANCWIDPTAFALPAVGTTSTMKRSNVPGPMFWQFDLSLSRVFKLTERQGLEVRAESFNLTNSFRAGVASGLQAGNSGLITTFGSGTFGRITSALDPRIMQFAMKYTF